MAGGRGSVALSQETGVRTIRKLLTSTFGLLTRQTGLRRPKPLETARRLASNFLNLSLNL